MTTTRPIVICDDVTNYVKYCEDNPDKIDNDIKLLLKNIVLPVSKDPEITFDADMHAKCVKYIENNYYPLFPFQKFILPFIFLYKNGKPVFTKFLIMMGRGGGKDGILGPLSDFFTTPLYGVREYNVDIVATAEWQAENTFKVVHRMKDGNPKFKGKCQVTKKHIYDNTTKSELRYNSSNASTKDGKQIGCLILNEIHAYETYDQINVFESAFGKVAGGRSYGGREYPKEFIITTQGYVREGPLDDTLSIARNVLEQGDLSMGWFPVLYRLDTEEEVDDPEKWIKANPSLPYLPVLAEQIAKDYKEAKANPKKMPEFRTKRCNLPDKPAEVETVTSWRNILRCSYDGTTDEELERKQPREVPDTSGQPAIIALDYADLRDFASLGVLTISGADYVWKQHTWIDRNNPDFQNIRFPLDMCGQPGFDDFEITSEPVIPVADICDHIDRLMIEYDVRKITLDTYRFTLFKAEFEARGWVLEDKTHPEGIIRLIRQTQAVTAYIAPLIQAAYETGNVIYGDSAIMRWYTNNVAVHNDKYGNKRFEKQEQRLRKTDGFMAFNIAMYSKDLIEEAVSDDFYFYIS